MFFFRTESRAENGDVFRLKNDEISLLEDLGSF